MSENPLTPTRVESTWEMSSKAERALEKARRYILSSHGMYAGIPMQCKGDECPVHETCPLYKAGEAPLGERCPIEIAFLVEKYDGYRAYLGVHESDMVDMGLLKDLIDAEIMIFRCERILAGDPNVIKRMAVGMTDKNKAIYRDEVHKAIEIKERQQKRKNEILQLLNSTRKDQEGTKRPMDMSQFASHIMQEFKKMNEASSPIIDVEPTFPEQTDV